MGSCRLSPPWGRRGGRASSSVDYAEQWGYQLAEERKRLGFTQAGLAGVMGVSPGRVSQIEHSEVATGEAVATYVSALGGKLELPADIGGHLLKLPTDPAA
jgi:transcriptional regulator with XRE-family HTH domain